MCKTITLEFGKNTLFSDIKAIFSEKYGINSNDIFFKIMPLGIKPNDNDSFNQFPSIERSFIMMYFTNSTQDIMIKKFNQEKNENNNEFQISNDSDPKLRIRFDSKKYTIFSENYQTHSSRKLRYNYTRDDQLENMSLYEKNSIHYNNSLPNDFVSNLIVKYKDNDINGFKELMQKMAEEIKSEVKNYPYPYNNFKVTPDNVANDFNQKIHDNPQILNEIIESIQKDSPEAAEILINNRNEILKQENIDI